MKTNIFSTQKQGIEAWNIQNNSEINIVHSLGHLLQKPNIRIKTRLQNKLYFRDTCKWSLYEKVIHFDAENIFRDEIS